MRTRAAVRSGGRARGVEHNRRLLHCIQRRRAMKDDEVPARDNLLASPRFSLKRRCLQPRWASPTATFHKQWAAWRCPIKPIFAAVPFVASWHNSEVTNEASDFRLGGQSGLSASVARTAALDPNRSCGALFCCDARLRPKSVQTTGTTSGTGPDHDCWPV